jgi:DNA-binding response OmpR family regulator
MPHREHLAGSGECCILLVEDDEVSRRVIVRALRHRGFTVCGASSARAALAIYDAVKPELVITDIEMPELDGVYLLQALQRHDASVCAAAFTGLPESDPRIQAALDAGASVVIRKPLTAQSLDSALDEVFGRAL